jgi:antitoxin CptB
VSDDRRLDRLRWHCRRGMLELDLILARVLERDVEHFTARELDLFEQLLALEDTTLFDTLQGVAEPTDPELKQLVEKIRQ